MAEPTITCPQCKNEIKLTESLAAPLLESVKRDYEQRLSQKDANMTQREQALADRAQSLERVKATLDQQVAQKLQQERVRIAAEEQQRAKLALGNDLDQKTNEISSLQEVLKQRDIKLAEAQKAQAELIRKQRELDDAKRELDLTVEKRVQADLTAERDKARKEAEEELKLKVMEKDQTITAMQRQIEDLRRRAEQGSQQLQGEVQEMELEALLAAKFPRDTIQPVPKGEFGGDVLHRVIGPLNQGCGTILWECKRTKSWSDGWLPKLREDQRAAKAEIAVIISQALPKEVETFGLIDGVWIADPKVALPVALSLRQTLIEVAVGTPSLGRPADENGNGLRLSHRTALSSTCSSDCRSLLIHERRSRSREEGDYPTMGQARGTDRSGYERHGRHVRRPPGYRRKNLAGDRRAGISGDVGIPVERNED